MSSAFNLNTRPLPRLLTIRRMAVALTLAAIVAVVIGASLLRTPVAYGSSQDLDKLKRFLQTRNTPAMKLFREGRDLIENEEWAKAAQTFSGFINTYPRDSDVDAALYWYAYALKRQGNAKEAAKQLKRLIKDHGRSGWRDEADAMLAELAPALGEPQIINNALSKENEELKIIALQSLFESSPERAMAFVAEWLKPNSTASRRMKESAVSLLGAHGGKGAVPILLDIARNQPDVKLRQTAIHRLGEAGGEAVLDDLMQIYAADREGKIKQQILHALAEMESPRAHAKLLDIARTASEPVELRRSAIHRLGERDNPSALDDLLRVYEADANLEIRRQIIHAIGESSDPRAPGKLIEIARSAPDIELRRAAIHRLGEKNNDAMLDELMKLYQAEGSVEIKRQIIHAFSEMESPRAKSKLLEVARATGENVELRRAAIHRLGESNDTASLTMLISLYDGEPNVEIKRQLIHAFSESRQKEALRKLMQIARSDASLELRRAAVHRIGESKDPDALRFLEDLLKP